LAWPVFFDSISLAFVTSAGQSAASTTGVNVAKTAALMTAANSFLIASPRF
jgi:hypothetical protein